MKQKMMLVLVMVVVIFTGCSGKETDNTNVGLEKNYEDGYVESSE